jgi:hypothetical protein
MAELVSDVFAMLASFSVVVMLAHVIDNSPRAAVRTRWHAIALVLAAFVMAVLMVASEVAFDGDFAVASARSVPLIAHQVVFHGYLGSCTVRFMILMRRYLSRPGAQSLMRRGMLVVVLAAAVGLMWMAWNLLIMVVARFGGHLMNRPTLVSAVLGATAAILLAAGTTLPTWGSWLQRIVRHRRVDHALRDITPLWELLVTEIPKVKFSEANLTDPEDVLYRHVIEIRDAQLVLNPFAAPGTKEEVLAASAASDRPDQVAARTEAAALATAIDAHRAGQRQLVPAAPPSHPEWTDLDVLVEAAALIRVYTALRHDPIVASIEHRARQRLGVNRSGAS